ncbi:MAG: response regulator [Gemmatimonadetes bacterium]|nr:response regulator [Gemmatimonadota bacterium]
MTNDPAALQQRVDALERRLSGLCGAILQISSSLELETVLQGIVDSARELTDADFGGIATIDEKGQPLQFVSSGITSDEHRRIVDLPEGMRLFAYLRDNPGRLPDVPGLLGSLGFGAEVFPYQSAQGMPIHHRGVLVGSLCLAKRKGGRECTAADEEVLKLFASQAAMAIVNARTYRDEQRARAHLEALIDTSPIGVVVLDAETGRVVSINREVRRIFRGLQMPGRRLEELPQIFTCQRADGREIAFTEMRLVHELSSAETLRNEELVLTVPDGRSVRTLVNVTPIRKPRGGVDSVLVTIQDLAPFEEIERMRTEFLAIVSHELRAPLTSIKGSTATVLAASPPFAPAELLQFFHIIDAQADRMSGLIGDLLDAGRIATGTLSVSPQPSDPAELVDQARNTFLSGGGRHPVLVDLPPELPRVMVDRQRVVQILNNLFSNSARNAPESSPIRVSARRDGVHVTIAVSDRGRGIAAEQLPHLFRKHASAAEGEGGLGGGLGLAICKGLVEAHGGRIWATSEGEGRGASFAFTLPLADEADADPGAAPSLQSRAASGRRGREPVRILVVDDDPDTLRYVRDVLTTAGYTTLTTGDHGELGQVIRAEKPRLVLLDLMLPGTDGIQLMERVPELADLPVIFISAYGRDETIARALGAGASDYIVKPFSPTELTARVRAALRGHAEPKQFRLGELSVDYTLRRVTVAGRPVELTATEYEVLRVLSVNAGQVATYRSIMRRAWRRQPGHVNPKLVHAVVKRLRHKLGQDGFQASYILNERGVGYRMPSPHQE